MRQRLYFITTYLYNIKSMCVTDRFTENRPKQTEMFYTEKLGIKILYYISCVFLA